MATITLPANRVYNNDQNSPGITAIADDKGCSLTCLLDIANIFGPVSFTPAQISAACQWNANGVGTWALPGNCSGSINHDAYTTNPGQAKVLQTVRAQVDANNPVIVKMINSVGGAHFVVAYGYTGSCSSLSEVQTLDPAGGRLRTLQEAVNYCHKTNVISYIIGVRG